MQVKQLIVLLLGLSFCAASYAQDSARGEALSKEVGIDFKVGTSAIDPSFGNNAEHLAELDAYLVEVENDTTLTLVRIILRGSASPEGHGYNNLRLAKQRCSNLESYIRARISIPASVEISYDSVIAWDELADIVRESDMPYKDAVLDVLINVPEYTYNNKGALVDSRKKHLMEIQYGRTWYYMVENLFPQLRNAGVVFETVRIEPEPEPLPEPEPQPEPVVEPAPAPQPADTVEPAPEPAPVQTEEPKKPFYMALKTNMLFDAAAVPNIGIEFYLGQGWSLSANWMYSWWDSYEKNRFWRLYGGEIGLRKWFGKRAAGKPLTGHHLGIYGQLFTYDFEWHGKGYIGGSPEQHLWYSPNYAAGIEYGYSLPVARRLNIDFSVGLGYWGGRYYTYNPQDGHYVWESTKNRHWIGPTKAEISLVWLLGRGNYNNK